MPLNQQIFVHKRVEATIVASLPFEVEGPSETMFAGVYEFTLGKSLLSLQILSAATREVVAMSEQGKYFSRIDMAVLPTGSYVLVVRNDAKSRDESEARAQGAPIEYMLDVIRQQVPAEEDYMDQYLAAMQVCSVPETPKNGLTQAGYLHPLGGYQLSTVMQWSLLELDSGATLPFTLPADSRVTAYLEASEDIPVALSASETGGMGRVAALSSD